ncbi:beta-1,3-galactosyltransferase 1-like isoform X2 [Drosophila kikkawai]|uniref:Hexosyltransferase n=1 Tax=Drosophila kikkawai TaxID=30033 RepID=A0A6P4HYH4_DROKI|nr:beta-1,3-galactosyltransferase 1-like isoform X2 [Drosophila kikkawai]
MLKIYFNLTIILAFYTAYNIYMLNRYNFIMSRTTEWPKDALDLTANISPFEDTALIKPQAFCGEKTFLLIFVESSVRNFLARQAIRETWGNSSRFNYPDFQKLHGHLKGTYYPPLKSRLQLYSEYLTGKDESLRASVRVLFIIGRSRTNEFLRQLREEADQHNDIIMEDFIDSYRNLTLKTVLALKHLSSSCYNTTAYVLKTDDNAFVNIPNLLHILLGGSMPTRNSFGKKVFRLTTTSNVLLGKKLSRAKPIVDVKNKWYMPHYMYPNNTYPAFLVGKGYLMSMDVVKRLYEAAWYTKVVHLEDVFVTGLCAVYAGVERMHSSLFPMFRSKRLCNYKNSIIRERPKGLSFFKVFNFVTNYSIKCTQSHKAETKPLS